MTKIAETSDQGTIFGNKLPRVYTDKITVSGNRNVSKKLEIKIKFSIRDRADDFDDYILFDNDLLLDSILLDFFVSFDGLASEDVIAGKNDLWYFADQMYMKTIGKSPSGVAGLPGIGPSMGLRSLTSPGERSEPLETVPVAPTAMTMPGFDPLRLGGSVGFGTMFPMDNPFLGAGIICKPVSNVWNHVNILVSA